MATSCHLAVGGSCPKGESFTINFSDLNVADDRNRVTTYLADMTQRMIRSLWPRVEAATRADV